MTLTAIEAEVQNRRRALNQYQAGDHVDDDLYRALIREHNEAGHPSPMVNLCPVCADA